MSYSDHTQRGLSRRAAIASGVASIWLMGNVKGLVAPTLATGERGRVARVIDGDSFVLALADDTELSVRLSAIEAPRTAQRSEKAWPYSKEAKAGLSALIQGRQVQLFYGGETRDRFGRAIAQVRTLDNSGETDLWVQGELLRLGLARVYSWKGELADMNALYAFENQARARGRGLWADPTYAIRSPDPNPLAQDVDSWQIIEGIITSTADVRGRIYLNFGADYKTDFTVAIAKKNVKTFEAVEPLTLLGARVRVRGWIEMINGPMIWLNHPERLEILS